MRNIIAIIIHRILLFTFVGSIHREEEGDKKVIGHSICFE